jgi:hypothetical protein
MLPALKDKALKVGLLIESSNDLCSCIDFEEYNMIQHAI